MERNTTTSAHIHAEGDSHFCCFQSSDRATIHLGEGYSAALTMNIRDFLQLASLCERTAKLIANRPTEEEAL